MKFVSKSIEDSTPLIMTSKVFKLHVHIYSTIGDGCISNIVRQFSIECYT